MPIDIENPGPEFDALFAALELLTPRVRLAVDWFDETNSDFSSGTIDTTVEPYSENAVEGQTAICAAPNTVADSGIWVLGDVTDPANVPVTRRSDSEVGAEFRNGEIIYVEVEGEVGGDGIAYKFSAQDSGFNALAKAIIGTDFVLCFPLLDPQGTFESLSVGSSDAPTVSDFQYSSLQQLVTFISDVGPTALPVHSKYVFVDASANNVAVQLPPDGAYHEIIIKRVDEEAFTCTISVGSGDSLEGATNGTKSLGGLESCAFKQSSGDTWWITGQYVPA